MKKIGALMFLCGTMSLTLSGANTSKVWQQWLDAKKAAAPLPFPDFSYAGYANGERPIPEAKGKVFDVTVYGAVAEDGKSDKEAIRRAIAAAKEAGGGVVYFPAGRFIGHGPGDDNLPIFVDADNIVLKGAGAHGGGTEIQYLSYMTVDETGKLSESVPLFQLGGPITDNTKDRTITQLAGDTALGQRYADVVDAGSIKPGDIIRLIMVSKEAAAFFMPDVEVDKAWTKLNDKGLEFREAHRVRKVEGNRLWFEECCNVPMKASWKIRVAAFAAVKNIGVEDITFRNNWRGDFAHHRSWLDDSAYCPLEIGRTADSYVRRVRIIDANRPLISSQNLHFSVLCYSVEGNGGHTALSLEYFTQSSFAGWADISAPAWHGPGTSGGASAIVFYRQRFTDKTAVEIHASQPYASLFDSCTGGLLYGRNGGAVAALPNHLGMLLFWNFEQVGKAIDHYKFWDTANKYDRVYKPWLIGWHGSASTFREADLGLLESLGEVVEPKSLYLAQMEARLGKVPEWFGEMDVKWAALLEKWKNSPAGTLLVSDIPDTAPKPKAPKGKGG